MGERNHRYQRVEPVIDGPRLPDAAGMAADRPYSVGSLLREAREDRGLALNDVARDLRIRHSYLQAIEDGRFTDLPGVAYATGFLRTYAEHLDLDPDLVLRRFKEESSDAIRKSELYMPEPVPEGRIPGGTVLLLAVICAGAVYGGWYYMTSTGRELVDFVPPLPERIAAMIDVAPSTPEVVVPVDETRPDDIRSAQAPVEAPAAGVPDAGTEIAGTPGDEVPDAGSVAQAPVTAPAETPPAETPSSESAAEPSVAGRMAGAEDGIEEQEMPVPSGTVADIPRSEDGETASRDQPVAAAPVTAPNQASEPERVADVPSPPPPPPPPVTAGDAAGATGAGSTGAGSTGRVYGVVNGGSRIQLRAVQDSWVQVRDGSGDLLFARVLRPGDVYQVPDQGGLRMVTGNAGGLVAVVDGVVAGQPMGRSGQVMRDITLDPQRLGIH
ncbi:MAG TPA: RodZ domain-containing protein [Arenibaculum sp.]|nr:RodZ domain-containing protein [Arenibaculum sp.]